MNATEQAEVTRIQNARQEIVDLNVAGGYVCGKMNRANGIVMQEYGSPKVHDTFQEAHTEAKRLASVSHVAEQKVFIFQVLAGVQRKLLPPLPKEEPKKEEKRDCVPIIPVGTVCKFIGNTNLLRVKINDIVTVSGVADSADSDSMFFYNCYHHESKKILVIPDSRVTPLPLPEMKAGHFYRVTDLRHMRDRSVLGTVNVGSIIQASSQYEFDTFNGVKVNCPIWYFMNGKNEVALEIWRVTPYKLNDSSFFNPLVHECSK